ncbi:MAG TPA: MFS transporter [Paracoccus sp. (in: a-proteobacteria)]|uniref:MFS transporter n=1 Tax=uncultured Paracoccus sp. TaxID=189685 RepID=UPI0026300843|nr:MFS transporter [uncultured Paracoccus sp.]HMQ41252.1 MFS transporter [Paracoccus sp. (in: a-proteobacteria)]HMR37514.1 MFS transporter [Paracoccus sp. (in: a-proteobacteria)]
MSDQSIRQPSRALWSDSGWCAVTAAFTLNGFLFGVWASRIPSFKEEFALSQATLGFLLLGLAGGAITSFPFAGGLSERLGAARMTVLCAIIYCPALVALSLAPSVILLGMALFVFGAMHGSMDVAMNGWAAKVETRMARPTMSIFHAMFSLGAGLGAASGYIAVKLGLAPAAHFLLMAGIGGAIALRLMWPERDATPPIPAASHAERKLFALPKGPLLLVGLVALAISMGEGGMADWSAVFLQRVVQVSEAQAALGYAAFSATMVLTRLAGGLLVQWLGPVGVTRMSGLMACLGLVIVIFAPGLSWALFGFALVGIGYALIMPLVFSRAANDPDLPPGPAIASVATVGYSGMLLGPPVVGFVAELFGLRVSFAMLALLALWAAAMAPVLRVAPSR